MSHLQGKFFGIITIVLTLVGVAMVHAPVAAAVPTLTELRHEITSNRTLMAEAAALMPELDSDDEWLMRDNIGILRDRTNASARELGKANDSQRDRIARDIRDVTKKGPGHACGRAGCHRAAVSA